MCQYVWIFPPKKVKYQRQISTYLSNSMLFDRKHLMKKWSLQGVYVGFIILKYKRRHRLFLCQWFHELSIEIEWKNCWQISRSSRSYPQIQWKMNGMHSRPQQDAAFLQNPPFGIHCLDCRPNVFPFWAPLIETSKLRGIANVTIEIMPRIRNMVKRNILKRCRL